MKAVISTLRAVLLVCILIGLACSACSFSVGKDEPTAAPPISQSGKSPDVIAPDQPSQPTATPVPTTPEEMLVGTWYRKAADNDYIVFSFTADGRMAYYYEFPDGQWGMWADDYGWQDESTITFGESGFNQPFIINELSVDQLNLTFEEIDYDLSKTPPLPGLKDGLEGIWQYSNGMEAVYFRQGEDYLADWGNDGYVDGHVQVLNDRVMVLYDESEYNKTSFVEDFSTNQIVFHDGSVTRQPNGTIYSAENSPVGTWFSETQNGYYLISYTRDGGMAVDFHDRVSGQDYTSWSYADWLAGSGTFERFERGKPCNFQVNHLDRTSLAISVDGDPSVCPFDGLEIPTLQRLTPLPDIEDNLTGNWYTSDGDEMLIEMGENAAIVNGASCYVLNDRVFVCDNEDRIIEVHLIQTDPGTGYQWCSNQECLQIFQ